MTQSEILKAGGLSKTLFGVHKNKVVSGEFNGIHNKHVFLGNDRVPMHSVRESEIESSFHTDHEFYGMSKGVPVAGVITNEETNYVYIEGYPVHKRFLASTEEEFVFYITNGFPIKTL